MCILALFFIPFHNNFSPFKVSQNASHTPICILIKYSEEYKGKKLNKICSASFIGYLGS